MTINIITNIIRANNEELKVLINKNLPELFTLKEYNEMARIARIAGIRLPVLSTLVKDDIIYPASFETFIACDKEGCIIDDAIRYFYRLT